MPRLPVTRARTAYLPLMLQPGGWARSSGNKAARISRSRSVRQAAPSRAPSLRPTRNSCGAMKQPFHRPCLSSLARASSSLKRPVAEASTLRAKPWRTSNWLRRSSRPRPCRRQGAASGTWGRRRGRRSAPGGRRSIWSVDRAPRCRRSSYRHGRRCRAGRRRGLRCRRGDRSHCRAAACCRRGRWGRRPRSGLRRGMPTAAGATRKTRDRMCFTSNDV